MIDEIGETVVYLLAGMRVKIKAPVNVALSQGWFPSSEDQYVGDSLKTPLRGFIVEDENVGTIELSSETEVSVIYYHKKAAENRIWFFAATGEKAVCTVSSVPIHDHSSVVQGGPAYGTYFSDDEVVV